MEKLTSPAAIIIYLATSFVVVASMFSSNVIALGNSGAYCRSTTAQGPGTEAYVECEAEYDRYFNEFGCGSMGGSGASGPQNYLDCLARVENQLRTDSQPPDSGNGDTANPEIIPITAEERSEIDNVVDFNQGGQFTCNGVSTSIEVACEVGVNPIYSYVTAIVNFIAAGVGIAIVANVMIGGVQYMTSRGNPQNTQAAISRITNAFIALFAFIFLWAFFNWLIPTGIL